MRKHLLVAVFSGLAFVAACTSDRATPTPTGPNALPNQGTAESFALPQSAEPVELISFVGG